MNKVLSARVAPAAWARERATPLMIFLAYVLFSLFSGTETQVYDSFNYWRSSQLLWDSPLEGDGLGDFRGVLTAAVFLPAAFLTSLLGPESVGFSILLQNALFLGWAAAFLLPFGLKALELRTNSRARWLLAFLFWVVMVGFAPYALVDVYAAMAILAAVMLLGARHPLAWLIAGTLGGVAINVRPAYMIALLFLIIGTTILRWRSGVLMGVGVIVGLAPQLIVNLVKFGTFSLFPIRGGDLVGLQAGFAAYVVRYDTVIAAENPRRFYCSPTMAQAIGTVPDSPGELVSTFLQALPHSLVFSVEKIASSLYWSLDSVYTVPMSRLDTLYAAVITVITVFGLGIGAILLWRSRHHWRQPTNITTPLFGLVAMGSVVSLVGSASESRFALPLVLIGILGCVHFSSRHTRQSSRGNRAVIITLLVAALVVFVIGHYGLSFPARAGLVDLQICASLR